MQHLKDGGCYFLLYIPIPTVLRFFLIHFMNLAHYEAAKEISDVSSVENDGMSLLRPVVMRENRKFHTSMPSFGAPLEYKVKEKICSTHVIFYSP